MPFRLPFQKAICTILGAIFSPSKIRLSAILAAVTRIPHRHLLPLPKISNNQQGKTGITGNISNDPGNNRVFINCLQQKEEKKLKNSPCKKLAMILFTIKRSFILWKIEGCLISKVPNQHGYKTEGVKRRVSHHCVIRANIWGVRGVWFLGKNVIIVRLNFSLLNCIGPRWNSRIALSKI